MVFVYSFTIEGYDVIITIEFFPHVIVLEDSPLESTNDDFDDADIFLNLWKQLIAGSLFCFASFYYWNTLLLEYFNAGLFLYCSMLFIVLMYLL